MINYSYKVLPSRHLSNKRNVMKNHAVVGPPSAIAALALLFMHAPVLRSSQSLGMLRLESGPGEVLRYSRHVSDMHAHVPLQVAGAGGCVVAAGHLALERSCCASQYHRRAPTQTKPKRSSVSVSGSCDSGRLAQAGEFACSRSPV